MKKRLLSLLVAISMVLTFLPVSALTAAAEEGSSSAKLEIEQGGYPKGSHNGVHPVKRTTKQIKKISQAAFK